MKGHRKIVTQRRRLLDIHGRSAHERELILAVERLREAWGCTEQAAREFAERIGECFADVTR